MNTCALCGARIRDRSLGGDGREGMAKIALERQRVAVGWTRTGKTKAAAMVEGGYWENEHGARKEGEE